MSDNPAAPFLSALLQVGAKKNLTEKEIGRLKAIINRVGYVESKNTPDAVQVVNGGGTGPGRGEFQYEMSGKNGSSATARNQLKKFEKAYGKVDLPQEDRDELAKDVPDFSQISQDGQRAVLLAEWVMKTPADEVGDLARGHIQDKDFWLDYHWAGHGGDQAKRAKKGKQWDREMLDYAKQVGRANP